MKNRMRPVVFAWAATACDKNQPSQNGPLICLSVEGRLNDAVKAARANGGKVLQGNSRSGRTDFAPSSSIPKEIASRFIHPRSNI
jgi:hypothetical protein